MEIKNYKPRIIDNMIDEYLKTFGAVCIEGAKWCGKTWSSIYHSNSSIMIGNPEGNFQNKKLAETAPNIVLEGEKPRLIDEWQEVPRLWDAVRYEVDKTAEKGQFILTGSATPNHKGILHSGAGRIGKLRMRPMSLYESGDSTGDVSLQDLCNGNMKEKLTGEVDLRKIIEFIVRGGWPESLNIKKENYTLIPKSYIDSILNIEINEEDKIRDKNKMNMLLKSLARNEATIVNNKTIIKDIEEYETGEDLLTSRTTIIDYLDFLERLHLIENQEAYSLNYRSPERVGKSVKRHLVDPSLACACLNLNVDKLMKDLNTFGFLFEALVERDLRVYMDYLDGKLYHFRDNVSGVEVDSILEFEDGEYAAAEIKLGYNEVDNAIRNLQIFYNNMVKKPKFMCVIVGVCQSVYKDPNTGIYVVPITALRP